jgi:hypothetical protein
MGLLGWRRKEVTMDHGELVRSLQEEERRHRELLKSVDLSPMFESARRLASIGEHGLRLHASIGASVSGHMESIWATQEAARSAAEQIRRLNDSITLPAFDHVRRLEDQYRDLISPILKAQREADLFRASSYVAVSAVVDDARRFRATMESLRLATIGPIARPMKTPQLPPLRPVPSAAEELRRLRKEVKDLKAKVAEQEARLDALLNLPPPPPPPPDDPNSHTGQYL